MHEPSETKYEIENKLEKELNNLNLLKERVSRSSQLTKGMVGILSSFEHRLARLEETILPVYNETGNLQRRQENIERTLAALDHVVGFYGVSQDVEPIVRAGPGPVANGGSGLNAFLQAMNKLQLAQEYFEKNNPQSVELENVSTLFNSGGDALNREFKELLLRHSRPVSPIMLLELVEDTPVEETPVSLNQFPETVSSELKCIADWLIMHNRDEYMNVYARVRATVLLKSLQQLKEQQRSSSGGSIQGIPAANSPMVRPKFQTPGRRASKRLHMFEKKANKMLQIATQTLEHSTGFTIGNRRSALHLESREDIVDEQEMENYLVCVMALQRLMQSERSLMVGIVPLQHQHQVFEIIIRDAMDMVVQDGENIASRAKRCINRHDFAAVLVVFPILKHLLTMRPEFERTVEGCDYNVRSKFASILNTLHGTGAKALEDFIESVRSDPSTQLPKDGTVHELTSNVLVFLEQLLDYVDTIGGVLAQDSVYSNALTLIPGHGKVDKNKALVGIYIKKVLVQLNLTLVGKSDLYSDIYLRAVFRLNNNHYVLKALQRAGLLDLVQLSEPDCEESYHDMIREHKRMYSQSWSRVLSHICGAEDAPITMAHAGKLRDKDRHLIKERFAGFNKEMEEIARVQRSYSIPDVELRESLKRDNKEYILPKYHAFYEKYSTVPFTKNPEKYIKYAPAQVSALIDRFFDVAA
ncbi:exocyst complex component 7 isoform X1 [Zootermopsis nevadensis]|uniref:Exocyst complex component 7 n=2 Tax=Zootermopsis nevadensis TaxID=136037 RepID=A0A067QTF9_ZOONE|nr:exocyst complex component 7 isoform X1 [Zootermopsis nevadensis]KDR13019.1 Exocyst complex component 7 [Zootermopsis nevadensis]